MDQPGFVLITHRDSTRLSSCISFPCPYRRIFSLHLMRVRFSQIDFSDAYLQVELDEDSKRLCNINTHRGVYEYQRSPFGVKSAPGIFQAIMDNMLAGLPFATAYQDDIVVVSRNLDEHRRHLHAVFDRINEYGFRVHLGKCSFYQPSIKYL
jgi:hypothetical protein